MSKKDYQQVADVLRFGRTIEEESEIEVRDRLAEAFADEFEKGNPRFNRERFLKAAGVGEFAGEPLMNGSTSTPTVYVVLDTWFDENPACATAVLTVHHDQLAAEEAVAYCYIEEAAQMVKDELIEGESLTLYDALSEVVGDADHFFWMDGPSPLS